MVGDDDEVQTFYIHESILSKHSGYFEALLRSDFEETKAGIVRVRTDDPTEFSRFASFVYSGRVHVAQDKTDTSADDEYYQLVQAWILGESLMAGHYQDAIVDTILTKLIILKRATPNLHAELYDYTERSSAMRRLLVDIAVFTWTKERIMGLVLTPDSVEFLHEVLLRYHEVGDEQRRRKAQYLYEDGLCKYHEHGTSKPCYRTMFPGLEY